MSSAWDEIPDRPFVRFANGVVVVMFESDEPTKTVNKYNQPQWNFDVDGDLWLGVSSKNLMRLLKRHRPLTGKTLRIERHGSGYNTTYTVEEVGAP